MSVEYTITNRDDLGAVGDDFEFEGFAHGGARVSFISVDSVEPGYGPRLHQHPYEEVFIIQEGRALHGGRGDYRGGSGSGHRRAAQHAAQVR